RINGQLSSGPRRIGSRQRHFEQASIQIPVEHTGKRFASAECLLDVVEVLRPSGQQDLAARRDDSVLPAFFVPVVDGYPAVWRQTGSLSVIERLPFELDVVDQIVVPLLIAGRGGKGRSRARQGV